MFSGLNRPSRSERLVRLLPSCGSSASVRKTTVTKSRAPCYAPCHPETATTPDVVLLYLPKLPRYCVSLAKAVSPYVARGCLRAPHTPTSRQAGEHLWRSLPCPASSHTPAPGPAAPAKPRRSFWRAALLFTVPHTAPPSTP